MKSPKGGLRHELIFTILVSHQCVLLLVMAHKQAIQRMILDKSKQQHTNSLRAPARPAPFSVPAGKVHQASFKIDADSSAQRLVHPVRFQSGRYIPKASQLQS